MVVDGCYEEGVENGYLRGDGVLILGVGSVDWEGFVENLEAVQLWAR